MEKQGEMEKGVVSDRVYFSMLEKVGTLGRYQVLLMTFIFIVGMQASACFLVNPYLFYEQEFVCPADIKDCREHVCALPDDLRAAFTPAPDARLSLANQFGDFRCEGAAFVTLLNTAIILGSVLGIFSAIFFTEWLGRRGTMAASLLLGVAGLAVAFIPSQTAAVAGVFLYGAGLDISYSCVFTFVTEFFAEENRVQFYNVISLSFALGIFLNPLAFYLIYDWRWVALLVFILPTLAAAIGFLLVVENTPIELIAYSSPEQIHAAFLRIAAWNRTEEHGLTLSGVREIKEEYDENQRKKHARVFTIVDLVRYKSLRAHILPLGALKFLMMFIYYAPGLLLNQFNLDIYVNGLVNALSQLAGIPIQQLLLQYERKMSSYLLFTCSAVFAVGMWLVKDLAEGEGASTAASVVLLFLYRICCTIVSFIVVVMLNETYPAQVRNLAIFVNISFGRSATLLVPFVVSFCETTRIPFLLLLAAVSLLGTATTCATTETQGVPPPEMIEEVRIQEHHFKHYHVEDEKDK